MGWQWLIGLISPAKEVISGWQKRKSAKLDSDLRINEARTQGKIKRLETGQELDAKWEHLSIQNQGWKDEYWTIILSIPCILCFFPGMVQYVKAGFEALQACPQWYKWCLLVAVGSSFGYRKLCDFLNFKKGN